MSNPLVMNMKEAQSKKAVQPNPFASALGQRAVERSNAARANEQAMKDERISFAKRAFGPLFGDFSGVPESAFPKAPPPSPSYEQLTAGQVAGPNVSASTEALPDQDDEGKRRRGGREQFAGGGAGIRVA